jgi:hypothetical protein
MSNTRNNTENANNEESGNETLVEKRFDTGFINGVTDLLTGKKDKKDKKDKKAKDKEALKKDKSSRRLSSKKPEDTKLPEASEVTQSTETSVLEPVKVETTAELPAPSPTIEETASAEVASIRNRAHSKRISRKSSTDRTGLRISRDNLAREKAEKPKKDKVAKKLSEEQIIKTTTTKAKPKVVTPLDMSTGGLKEETLDDSSISSPIDMSARTTKIVNELNNDMNFEDHHSREDDADFSSKMPATVTVKSADFPLHRMIINGTKQLNEYIDKHNADLTKKPAEYADRMKIAGAVKALLEKCDDVNHLHAAYKGISKERKFLEESADHKKTKLLPILVGLEAEILARSTFKYEDDRTNEFSAVGLYNEAVDQLKMVETDREVTPSIYSWIGRQGFSDGINPDKHTLKDELLGKLWVINDDSEMNNRTKYSEMRLIMDQFYEQIANSNGGKNSRLRKALTFVEPIKKPDVAPSAKSYAAGYEKIWQAAASEGKPVNEVEATLAILQDYAKSDGATLFFSGHAGRHHAQKVRIALVYFRTKLANKDDVTTVKDILDYFSNHLENRLDWKTTNPSGSLMRRLKFVAQQTKNEFKLNLEDKPAPTPMVSAK